ncbi:MAG: c-type cytochrome [Rhizobiaceae bacterium]|nr:c-type cytochrome [Rhizobiaceae bacterium]
MTIAIRMLTSLTTIAIFVAVSLFALPANAENDASIIRGAKLYDKWFAVIKAEKPTQNHPAWPAANTKKKNDVTWRCKSCHGWDYQGVDGAYGSGSYLTGIKGVNAMAGADPAKIVAIMKDDTHQYSGLMDEADFQDLAMFVSKGQIDMRKYIDYSAKAANPADAKLGERYYASLCAQCHGANGDKPDDMKKTLAKQLGNPWEVLHKILNGQPAEQMTALRVLDHQITLDLMAHLATLPTEK